MAFFKCKMCGGDLNVTEGATVVECEYCGTNQTVSCNDDENRGMYKLRTMYKPLSAEYRDSERAPEDRSLCRKS